MQRFFRLACAANGFVAVLLGAFGAHGLKNQLGGLADGALRLGWWETASEYHLFHALALGLVASFNAPGSNRALRVSGFALLAGIVLFSGSLYAMTLTGVTRLGAITPFGGLSLLIGWAALAVAAWRSPAGAKV